MDRSKRFYSLLYLRLLDAPGGLLESEIKELFLACGYKRHTKMGEVMTYCPFPVYDEQDSEDPRERWWKLIEKGPVPKMRQPKKGEQRMREKGQMARVDDSALAGVRNYVNQFGGTMQEFVSAAVREKLEKEGVK